MENIVPQPIPQKQCTKCKQFFPATLAYFYKDISRKDEFSSACKKCKAHSKNFGIEPHEQREGEKRCVKCNTYFPATTDFFHRNKNAKNGLSNTCKKCCYDYQEVYRKQPDIQEKRQSYQKEYLKTYSQRPEVRERRNAQSKIRYSTPQGQIYSRNYRKAYESRPEVRERRKIWNKQWNESHLSLPENREYRKAYYKRQEIRDQKRTYRASPEGKAVHRANSHRRRARQKAVQGTYTPEQIQDLLKRQKHKCYYCSTKFKKEQGEYIYHIDHTFPLNRVVGTDIPANDISYLVLACPPCNQKKNDKFPWEWPEGGRLL